MPSASSKPANQTASMEVQETAKMLIEMVAKKVRNLEKRKSKLENYRQLVTDGNTLNKDQEVAVSHFDEVLGMLEFAKDLQKTFNTVLSEVSISSKQQKKQAKKESTMKQENEGKKIKNILILQNILDLLGNENIRADFVAGTNGAVQINEDQLGLFDEFYKYINPTRDSDEEKDANGEDTPEKSYEDKLNEASEHLNSYLKAEDKKACEGATYKELKNLVDQIHDCGYLDNMPEFPEVEEEPAPVPTAAEEEPAGDGEFVSEEDDIEVEPVVPATAPVVAAVAASKSIVDLTAATDYGFFNAEQIATPSDVSEEQTLPASVIAAVAVDPPQQPPAMEEPAAAAAPYTLVSEHAVPEPIEMPPPKSQVDVTEVLAAVQGSFNFVQDSMVEYESSPHMDPAVLAVSQSYIPTQSYSAQASLATDAASPHAQPTHQLGQTIPEPITTQHTSLNTASLSTALSADQSYSSSDMSYGSTQSAYDNRPSQGLQQTLGTQQTLSSQSSMSTQQVLSGQSTLGGSSQQQQSSLGQSSLGVSAPHAELDYSSPQVEAQLNTEDQTSHASSANASLHHSMMGSQQPTQHIANAGTSTATGSLQQQQSSLQQDSAMQQQTSMQQPDNAYTQSLGSSQLASDSMSSMTDPTTGMPMHSTHAGSATPPQQQAQSGNNITPPKSTMNASAPPFQMTGSQRSSPQMQAMQSSQLSQQQDMGSFQSMDASQGDIEGGAQTHMSDDSRQSPPELSNEDSAANDYKGSRSSYTTYNSNYQPPNQNYRNGTRGGSRGGSTGGGGGGGGRGGNINNASTYRNNRSGMPFVRSTGPRGYPSQQSPRSGPGYSTGYIPRESYNQRAQPQDIGYNPNQQFGGGQSFGGRPQQQQDFYNNRRGGPPRGTSRGGRGMSGGPRGNNAYRGGPRGGGGFGKSPSNQTSQVSV